MYRIKEHKNKITGETKYEVQEKFLWWWNTCRREIGWNCDEPMIYDTYNEADAMLYERQVDEAW